MAWHGAYPHALKAWRGSLCPCVCVCVCVRACVWCDCRAKVYHAAVHWKKETMRIAHNFSREADGKLNAGQGTLGEPVGGRVEAVRAACACFARSRTVRVRLWSVAASAHTPGPTARGSPWHGHPSPWPFAATTTT